MNACKEITELVVKGQVQINDIDEKLFSEFMLTKHLPGYMLYTS